MTCVSPRSGIASSGTSCSARNPAIAAAATSSKTRNLFLTEKSMMRLIMVRARLHATLGIDEKRAGDYDPLSGEQPFGHFDVFADPPPGLDQPRLEVAVAVVYEHRLAKP